MSATENPTGQRTDAAERSAHVHRAAVATEASVSPVVEVAPGVWKLRVLVEVEAERDAARAGLLRAMQYENKCEDTGRACREPERCACHLEAATWMEGSR